MIPCDRCGLPGATVEQVQEGSHWWCHEKCPDLHEAHTIWERETHDYLQRAANRVEDLPACDVMRMAAVYREHIAALNAEIDRLRAAPLRGGPMSEQTIAVLTKAERDELVSEVRRYRGKSAFARKHVDEADEPFLRYEATVASLESQLSALKEERDALAEDQKRFDWLEANAKVDRENDNVPQIRVGYHFGHRLEKDGDHFWVSHLPPSSSSEARSTLYKGPSMRAAVDAAMSTVSRRAAAPSETSASHE